MIAYWHLFGLLWRELTSTNKYKIMDIIFIFTHLIMVLCCTAVCWAAYRDEKAIQEFIITGSAKS